MHKNLRTFIQTLKNEHEIVEISAEVDSYLEIAEIHRRVIESGGKALFFRNVKGSSFPVVTNLFGTRRRLDLAFGSKPLQLVKRAVQAAENLLPPTPSKLWQYRDLFFTARRLGTRRLSGAPVLQVRPRDFALDDLPLLQLWPEDGGHFITLPLVYTESPTTGKHNLGIYRMQRYDASSTGMHWQIGKGGGFHYSEAEASGRPLPVTVFLGGSPALMLSAIAPLPEDVPELLLASLLADEKITTVSNPLGADRHRLIAEAEFAICGSVQPYTRKVEGPFGDHYGYYSLEHNYPIFQSDAVFHRKNAIYPATVVGKPRQEDFFIGDYLQELLSPLFPLVMPAVRSLWSYGETGFHSLAAAVVRERYSREALSAGFRILGEGQLTLTKFLLLTDTPLDLRDFTAVLEHVLARAEWDRDLFILSQTAFDTLDYASGKINHGSKAILMGLGDPKRELLRAFRGPLPGFVKKVESFCPGCLAIEGQAFDQDQELGSRIAACPEFADWQLIVILDDAGLAQTTEGFLWATWTRFDPARDITAKHVTTQNNHVGYSAPVVIDARIKPWYPKEVEPDTDTVRLVDARWSEYGV
ncbi:MAG: UbiD family decarboxylase [Pyrinomonadaceae bacterium]